MHPQSLLFVEPPELSDKTATDMLDFLYQLTTAFENHYAAQLRRYCRQGDQSQADLFADGNHAQLPS